MWEVLGLLVIWLGFAAVGVHISQTKNRGPWIGFVLGFFLGVIGILVLVWLEPQLPPAPPGRRPFRCPRCSAVQNVLYAAERYDCWRCKQGVKVTPIDV